jgi:hypothetical protein
VQVNLHNAMESEGLMLFTKLVHHKNTNTCSWGGGIIVHYITCPHKLRLKTLIVHSSMSSNCTSHVFCPF